MDILNFISWIKGKRLVTTVDPAKTLLPVALKDGRRDDDYLTGAISVEDFAAQIKPYKVYTALLTQSGTANPVSNVLESTFTGSITFLRENPGIYRITSSNNEFTQNKILVHTQIWGNGQPKGRLSIAKWITNNRLLLYSNNSVEPGSSADAIGGNDIITSIEIRVYN